ncbi:hypothetical protein C2S52_009052 [Perilla frutescens var. hirtella]|nr:hypothetical protein C2S51_017419 [Perilla frutescens var. frutescens]KAH6784093.1 hypothetical protein C2S52_009052 [Perilla frutescens var. hirtella]
MKNGKFPSDQHGESEWRKKRCNHGADKGRMRKLRFLRAGESLNWSGVVGHGGEDDEGSLQEMYGATIQENGGEQGAGGC